jgi:hypothetical protein
MKSGAAQISTAINDKLNISRQKGCAEMARNPDPHPASHPGPRAVPFAGTGVIFTTAIEIGD